MNDPRHILQHARNVMIEQLIHAATPAGLTQKDFRAILERASDKDLREYWEGAIGKLLEEKGI